MTLDKPFSDAGIFNLNIKVKNGGRPEFNVEIPESYKDLIRRCWSQDAKKRPIFDQIQTELQHNAKYNTEKVDESAFKYYVRYIDEYKTSFESDKYFIQSNKKQQQK